MRKEEAIKIKEFKKEYYKKNKHFKNIINLGSGNVEALSIKKPWISKYIFNPCKESSRIIHIDSVAFPGVDIIRDLSLPNALSFCEKIKGSKLFILANVLEHIPKKNHAELLRKIYDKMIEGDGLIISAPYDYPYHADPIDNLFRPSPEQLKKQLPLKWLKAEIINAGSYREEFKHMKFLKKIRKLFKLLWPFQRLNKWLECHRIIYLFRQYKITVVFGVK